MSEEQKSIPEDLVYSRKVLEMVTVANEFCLFLEKSGEYPLDELLGFLQKISPLIYLKGSLLPDLEVEDEDATEHSVTEEQWEALFNLLHNKFGERDVFQFVDLQEKSHSDPVNASLAECFTDTYQDLKDFLVLYQNPLRSFKENAVRDCKRLFETRYGYKLLTAQAALHCILHPVSQDENIF
jgi:hypothetical protein